MGICNQLILIASQLIVIFLSFPSQDCLNFLHAAWKNAGRGDPKIIDYRIYYSPSY